MGTRHRSDDAPVVGLNLPIGVQARPDLGGHLLESIIGLSSLGTLFESRGRRPLAGAQPVDPLADGHLVAGRCACPRSPSTSGTREVDPNRVPVAGSFGGRGRVVVLVTASLPAATEQGYADGPIPTAQPRSTRRGRRRIPSNRASRRTGRYSSPVGPRNSRSRLPTPGGPSGVGRSALKRPLGACFRSWR